MCRTPVVVFFIHLNLMCSHTLIFNNPESEDDFYTKSELLHNVSNKILNLLEPKKKHVINDRVQSLQAMFDRQNHIAENLLSAFYQIQNMTPTNVTSNSIQLRNMLEDIMREERHHLNYVKKSTRNKFEKEFELFVNVFFEMSLKLSIKNVMKITNRARSQVLRTPRLRSLDIRAWKPKIEKYDLFNNTRRIYKGKKAKIKDFPFLVSILIKDVFMCAGSIISKDLVITAATGMNVLYKSDKYEEILRSIFVRVGSDYAIKNGHVVPVADVIFHPSYDPHTLEHNLAIVKMVKRLKYSKSRKIQKIQYDKDGVFKENSGVIVLGWGAKDANKEVNLKQKVSVARLYLFDTEKCVTTYSRFYVKDSNFCAGFSNKGGGACNKDTGGPGILAGKLAGVISFGPSVCGAAASPTVFTKIADHIDWINSVINQELYLKIDITTNAETMPVTEEMTKVETILPITNTAPAIAQQIPLRTMSKEPQMAQPRVANRGVTQMMMMPTTPLPTTRPQLWPYRPAKRIPKRSKSKLRPKALRSSPALNPGDLYNITLPFLSTMTILPTLFSQSPKPTEVLYPDEALILKEIFEEILLSNMSVIDYILYGEVLEGNVEAKYLMTTTESVDIMQHQLVNKSKFIIEKPEEIKRPVRTEIIKPTHKGNPMFPNLNKHDASSSDDDTSSQIELLKSLFQTSAKTDQVGYVSDRIKTTTAHTYSNNQDISSIENSEKKVTNAEMPKNTKLFGMFDDDEILADFSSKLKGELKDAIDEYYDEESKLKPQSTTSITQITRSKKNKIYENVIFDLNNIVPNEMARTGMDKHSGENNNYQRQKSNSNSFGEKLNNPDKMGRIADDKYGKENIEDNRQSYINNFKGKPPYKPNETPRIEVEKFNGENMNDEIQQFNTGYSGKLSYKKDEIGDDKYGGKNMDEKRQSFNNNFSDNFEEKLNPDEMGHIADDKIYGRENIKDKRQSYSNNFKEIPPYKQGDMGRIDVDKHNRENINDERQQTKNDYKEKSRYQQNEMSRIGGNKYSGEYINDKRQKTYKNNFEEEQQNNPYAMGRIKDDEYGGENDYRQLHNNNNYKENSRYKHDEIDRKGRDLHDDDFYHKKDQHNNNLKEKPVSNRDDFNKMGRYTSRVDNNYDERMPAGTTKNVGGIGEAITNDDFDYSDRDISRQNDRSNQKENMKSRYNANHKQDYDKRIPDREAANHYDYYNANARQEYSKKREHNNYNARKSSVLWRFEH